MFDLVTVLISKQSFFQHHIWPVYQSKSYLHGIALQDFCIVSSLFYKNSKQARVPIFVWLFRDVATTAKGPGCDEGTNLRFRGSSADAPRAVVQEKMLIVISHQDFCLPLRSVERNHLCNFGRGHFRDNSVKLF